MAQLVEIAKNSPRVFELGASNTLGRGESSTVRLDDALVSRSHAEIHHTTEGRYIIVDLGSSHGTYVGGKRVPDYVLSDGDEIIIGASRFVFRDDAPEKLGAAVVSITADDTKPWTEIDALGSTSEGFPQADDLRDAGELRRLYGRLRAVHEVNEALAVEGDIDTLLEKTIDVAFRLLNADRAVILLADPKTGWPVPRLAKQRAQDLRGMTLSRTLLQEVLATKRGLLFSDGASDVRFGKAESVVAQGIRSAMCVPMLHANELLGVMYLDSLMAANVFTKQDLDVFMGVAGQAALAIRNVMLGERLKDEARSRVQFQRFLAPSLVEQLIRGQLRLETAGELREVTVLFSDIRGFTKLTEHMDPADVMRLLNRYFETMLDILFRHGGTFDKYVGDALMALFGAPVAVERPVFAAVACALEMQEAMQQFNAEQRARGHVEITIGIGIHSGRAVCGAMGSQRAMQYTAIGDTVNTCSRVCAASPAGAVWLTEAALAGAADELRVDPLPPLAVRGKSVPLKVYRALGLGR